MPSRVPFRKTNRPPILYPAKPTVKVKNLTTGVHLDWDQAANATSFRVWRSASSNGASPTLLVTQPHTDPTNYTDTTSTVDTTFYYYVSALRGTLTNRSRIVAGKKLPIPDETPPATPSGLTATGDTDKIDLAWTA